MKKLCSILLALCMMIGIGAAGTVGASADLADDITNIVITDSLTEKMPYITQMLVYYLGDWENFRPEYEANLLPGKNLDDILSEVEAAFAVILDDTETFFLNTTVEDLILVIARCDEIFEESFNSEFLAELDALQAAYSKAYQHYFLTLTKLAETLENASPLVLFALGAGLDLGSDPLKEATDLLEEFELFSRFQGPMQTAGSIAELTAYCNSLTERAIAVIAKIDAFSTMKWWQMLPDWLQWILRYFCFGWIWMND